MGTLSCPWHWPSLHGDISAPDPGEHKGSSFCALRTKRAVAEGGLTMAPPQNPTAYSRVYV